MKKDNRINAPGDFAGNYEALGVDYLLIFSVRSIIENGEECTLERLVFECFTLFPKNSRCHDILSGQTPPVFIALGDDV